MDIEHGGGLGDQRRPCNVIIYQRNEGKHLLIDVAVIDTLALSHSYLLVRDVVSGPPTAYENVKRQHYFDLDASQYDFIPFILDIWSRRQCCPKFLQRATEKTGRENLR